MFHDSPVAYFLTWTCYGTWLHGDERGSVDRDHASFGTPFLPYDSNRRALDERKLIEPAAALGAEARRVVAATIQRHARVRRWDLHALNVRTSHVHVVVSCGDVRPEKTLAELKAWTTRGLRNVGLVKQGARVWTHHGSTRYLWDEDSLARATEYVCEHQGVDLE